jgi:formate--tetrahydrofolate ligase
LARAVAEICDGAPSPSSFRPLYELDQPLADKIAAVATGVYRASGVSLTPRARRDLARFEAAGWGGLPVCIAKTPYSFSADPALLGAPTDHVLPVIDVRLGAGAGFVVAICGDVMTMPGLPRRPAAANIRLDEEGRIDGLF